MPRVQALVVRDDRILMVHHQHDHDSWWVLPGGGQEDAESASEGALRELREECNVTGTIVRQTAHVDYGAGDQTITFLVDIGGQAPTLGEDPEAGGKRVVLRDLAWLALSEVPERDRAFLWAAGLLGVPGILVEVQAWGDDISYPGGPAAAT